MPNNNISVFSDTSESELPTGYSLQAVVLSNHKGDKVDIKTFVTDFTITESIYRTSLILNLNVKDTVNIIEEYKLTGQEVINVVLARKDYGSTDEQIINLDFLISEYPLLGKLNNRLQVFSISAISPYAFLSKLKRISRAYSGTLGEFIKSVLEKDLNVDPKKIILSKSVSPSCKFIVPNLAPLDAISWALRRSYDQNGSPFYCYQTLNGDIHIASQGDMVTKETYKQFDEGKFFKSTRATEADKIADYKERARRILSITSDFRMSKYLAGANGAYASTTNYLDLSTKTMSRKIFHYERDFKKMTFIEKNNVISPFFHPEKNNLKDTMSNYPDSNVNFISTNSKAFNGNQKNYHSPTLNGAINKAQAHTENLDTLIHDVSLCGDFKVNSGVMVDLKLSPSIDPQVTVKTGESEGDVIKDQFFSGRYLVTAAVHRFDDEYTVDIKLKKDSLPFTFVKSPTSGKTI